MIVKNRLSFVVTTALAIGTSIVQALPDARQGNPLGALGIQVPDSVGDIVRDHEKPNTLHVGPANIKQIKGAYTELDSSGAMCIDFVNIRKQAYFLPVTPAQKEKSYQDREFISNYFQISYSIPRANIETLNQIKTARNKVRNLENGHGNQAMVAQYNSLSAEWFELETQISSLNTEQTSLDAQNTQNIGTCIAIHGSDTVNLVKCITDNSVWYTTEKTKLDTQIAVPVSRKQEIQQDYFASKGEYEAYLDELTRFQDDITFNTLIISSQMKVTENAWKIEKDVLAAEEGKIVGRASAGYNLFDNEVRTLSQTLAAHGQSQFQIKQLDVFNVALNPGVTIDNPVVSTDNGAGIFVRNTWSFPADTLMRSSVVNDWEMPFERENRGDTIHFDTMDKDSFASGGFDFYVAKGARCGEYSQYVDETYTAVENGIEESWVVKQRFYDPQPNRVVFAQSVGLNYNYYAYPGPIRGSCSIDVDRMSNYWRNQGRSKSWSWFKTKTRSWDHTTAEARENMGMVCKLELKPVVNNPVEARELTEQFERHMYDDMWPCCTISMGP